MPRPLRIEYEGAWYHVMNRGSNKQSIFQNDQHYNLFLSLLEEITKQFLVEIHAYCLMKNHYHLLIKTPCSNLGKAMRYLNGVYTQSYNRLMERDGPLFRGRYKAILIDAEVYFLQVSRYIHLNPVEANICSDPEKYRWSSFQFFNETQPPAWLNTTFSSSLIDTYNIKSYLEFVTQGVDEETRKFYRKQQTRSIYANETFVKDHLEKIKLKSEFLSDINRTTILPDISIIIKIVADYFDVNIESLLLSSHGFKNFPRQVAIYLSRKLGQASHNKISQTFGGIKKRSVSAYLQRYQAVINESEQAKIDIDNLIRIIQLGGNKT